MLAGNLIGLTLHRVVIETHLHTLTHTHTQTSSHAQTDQNQWLPSSTSGSAVQQVATAGVHPLTGYSIVSMFEFIHSLSLSHGISYIYTCTFGQVPLVCKHPHMQTQYKNIQALPLCHVEAHKSALNAAEFMNEARGEENGSECTFSAQVHIRLVFKNIPQVSGYIDG